MNRCVQNYTYVIQHVFRLYAGEYTKKKVNFFKNHVRSIVGGCGFLGQERAEIIKRVRCRGIFWEYAYDNFSEFREERVPRSALLGFATAVRINALHI